MKKTSLVILTILALAVFLLWPKSMPASAPAPANETAMVEVPLVLDSSGPEEPKPKPTKRRKVVLRGTGGTASADITATSATRSN